MPNGCVYGGKCQYSHAKPPLAKSKDPKADSKAKPKAAAPKVAAAVAIVAAFSSIVTPSQAIGGLEWAADTGAGRHLVSYVALQEQGYHQSLFPGFANDSMKSWTSQQVVVSRSHPIRLGFRTKMES